jgi:hypothetical protein
MMKSQQRRYQSSQVFQLLQLHLTHRRLRPFLLMMLLRYLRFHLRTLALTFQPRRLKMQHWTILHRLQSLQSLLFQLLLSPRHRRRLQLR